MKAEIYARYKELEIIISDVTLEDQFLVELTPPTNLKRTRAVMFSLNTALTLKSTTLFRLLAGVKKPTTVLNIGS